MVSVRQFSRRMLGTLAFSTTLGLATTVGLIGAVAAQETL